MKTIKKRRVYALLATLIMVVSLSALFTVSPVSAAPSRSELEAQLKDLQAKEKEIKKNLSSASSSLSASKKRKELLESQIANATAQIQLMQQQLSVLENSIAQKNKEIGAAEQDIVAKETAISDTHYQLGLRLKAIAKTGNLSAIQRLLNTETYEEYLLKSKAAECIAARDQADMDRLEGELEEIRKQKENLEAQKAAIQEEQAEVKRLKAVSDSKKKELDTLHAAVQTEVRKLQSEVSCGTSRTCQCTTGRDLRASATIINRRTHSVKLRRGESLASKLWPASGLSDSDAIREISTS